MALSYKRIGTATSSSIVSLVSEGRGKNTIGTPFFTYVEECRYERGLLQNLESEIEVLATEWGKLVESFVHKMLPKEYKFHSTDTKPHPRYSGWVGTPDGSKYKVLLKKMILDAITDIKCPLTKKAFCQLVAGLYRYLPNGGVLKMENPDMKKALEKLREKAKDGNKFYWQLVSNSCIFNTKFAELIVFMPYKETLDKIINYNDNLEVGSWLVASAATKENKLPFILKESGYEEINIIRFEVPIADKKFLENRYRLFDFCMDLEDDKYDEFYSEAKKVKFIEDEVEQLMNQFKIAS